MTFTAKKREKKDRKDESQPLEERNYYVDKTQIRVFFSFLTPYKSNSCFFYFFFWHLTQATL